VPPVTVIVVNWNRREFLRECLVSLGKQVTYAGSPFPVEIIVVDNGSGDGSPELVMSEFPAVRLIRNRVNRGFCAANNQGIAAARGSRIALLNNDAVAEPHWLAALTAAFDGGAGIGMAASKIVQYEAPDRIDKAGHILYLDGQNRGRGTGEADTGQYDGPLQMGWPDGCAAMYCKAMLEQIGGFDEDLFAYADDAELGLRARIAGWECAYAPTAVVRHRRGATLGQGNPERVFLIERNRVLLAAKLFPWRLLVWNPYYFVRRLLAAPGDSGDMAAFPGWRGKVTLAMAVARADLAALWLLPRFLAKRRAIRRIARLRGRELAALLRREAPEAAEMYGK
jgi:GT2 family glycosyltransferase